MKICKKMVLNRSRFLTAGIILCLMIITGISGPRRAYSLDLKSQAEDFIRQERFAELLDFLDILRIEKEQDVADLQIEYYSVLAKSKYLDYLEKKEDWENYYNHVDIFNAEIIKSAKDFVGKYPASVETIDMQYLAWKAYVRDEETASADEAFNKLIEVVIAYTEENGDTDFFQEIAQRISDEGRVRQLNDLFESYKEFLLENAGSDSIERLGVIAEGYLEKDKIETAVVIYEHYIDLVFSRYSQAKAQLVLNEIANKFRHHGFVPAKDADFAEKTYELLTQNFGEEVLGEEALFARAYNLELSNILDRALEEYKYFVKKFPESELLPEVYTRLAIINLYSFGQIDTALQFFQKVADEFSDSFYAPFCTYNAAMLLQWSSEDEQASRLYSILQASGGGFSDAAKDRLNEIRNKEKMRADVRYVLEHLAGTEESSTIMMTLLSRPQRVFAGEQVVWSASAQDFSAGTVQPSFTYEWSGDTGSNDEPGNTAKFSTTYKEVRPHVVCFSALIDQTQSIICKALWVHELSVKTPNNAMVFKAGEPVEFSAEISPRSIEDKNMHWQWKIGADVFEGEGNKFSHVFELPGRYEIELVASMLGVQRFKKFNVDIIE